MKKYVLGLSLVGIIVLAGCSHQGENTTGEEIVTNPGLQEVLDSKTRADFSNEEKMNIHMCLMGGGEGCAAILDTENKDTYADALQEQCDIMAGMEACALYFGTEVGDIEVGDTYDLSANPAYPDQKKQQIVELADGDTYALTLENIQGTIGGKNVRLMAYNGSIPGPLIKVPQGARIDLAVTNNISDITSAVHHHGLRLQDTEDGVPVSMGGWDIPMEFGATNTYTLDFPDVGIYRYHPHVREDLQQELGMYGNYLVLPEDGSYWNAVDEEQVLVLDDIQLDENGVTPIYTDYTNQTIMGRFGTDYLINGTDAYTMQLTQGTVTRIYVTNTANVRPFNITIPGVEMKLVGSDLGAYEKETIVDSLLIAPAERYIIELFAPEAGTFDLTFKNPAFTESIGMVVVVPADSVSTAGERFETLRTVTQVVEDIDQYRQYFDQPVDRSLRLDMTLNGKTKEDLSLKMAHDDSNPMSAYLGGLTYDLTDLEREDEMFEMNLGSTDEGTKRQLIDEDTGKISTDIDDWIFDQGDIVKVRITNDGDGLHPMQHPIHFHGQRFLVLNKNGVPNDNLVWKDTVLTLPGEYLDILIDMSNPGKWMTHCHIAEHMHAGMMMNFEVREKEEDTAVLKKIGVEAFATAMENEDAILLDIRTPAELKETGVLAPDVLNIDFYAADYQDQLQALDKNASYLIYCRSGNRTGQTLKIMEELGFQSVLDLGEGINSWKAAEKETFAWEGGDEIRIITVDAQRFAFSPNEVRVKQGEKVALLINDIDTDHGAQFAEMEVWYEQNGNIVLDTSTPGTYEFACATMCGEGHRSMKGTVIVE